MNDIKLMYKGHDIFVIPSKKNTTLLYAPTLRKLIRIKDELTQRLIIKGLTKEENDESLVRLTAIFENAIPEAIKPFPVGSKKSKFFHLALGLTQDCTLNCVYCHANAGKRQDMSVELLEDAIFFAFDSAQKDGLRAVNVSFAVGGEPTTNWNLFTSCILKIKESEKKFGIPVRLSMTTNGYYGAKKRQFIAKYFQNILLSLDGDPEVQNLHRPSRSGSGSYNRIEETALYFLKNIDSFSIRATVSSYSVKKMPEIVEYFFSKFGNNYHLIFEPLVPLGRAVSNTEIIHEPSQNDFVEYFLQAKKRGKDLGLEVRTSASNQSRLVTSFCGAMSIPAFTVTTKGVVTTCERDSEGEYYWYGNHSLENRTFFLSEERILRNKELIKTPAKCNNCFCIWHCAGDCPDLKVINYDRCNINRAILHSELESKVPI